MKYILTVAENDTENVNYYYSIYKKESSNEQLNYESNLFDSDFKKLFQSEKSTINECLTDFHSYILKNRIDIKFKKLSSIEIDSYINDKIEGYFYDCKVNRNIM